MHRPYGYCAVVSVPSVKLQPQWAFVKDAKYKGEANFNGMRVDIWTYNVCTTLWPTCVEDYDKIYPDSPLYPR